MFRNKMYLLIVLIFITACNTSEIKSDFVGRWQIESDEMAIDFQRVITSPMTMKGGPSLGNNKPGQFIEYFEDGTYSRMEEEGGDYLAKGTFKIISEKRFEMINTIDSDNPQECKGEFVLQDDKLTIVCVGTYEGVPTYHKRVLVRILTE